MLLIVLCFGENNYAWGGYLTRFHLTLKHSTLRCHTKHIDLQGEQAGCTGAISCSDQQWKLQPSAELVVNFTVSVTWFVSVTKTHYVEWHTSSYSHGYCRSKMNITSAMLAQDMVLGCMLWVAIKGTPSTAQSQAQDNKSNNADRFISK